MSSHKHVYLGPYFECPYKMGSSIPPYDIVGDALCNLSTRTDRLWLAPNVARPGDPRVKIENTEGEEIHLNLTHVLPGIEVRWLMEAFAPEMEQLSIAYGEVLVKWGLHQYFM